jgi:hypothetical protein
VAIATAGLLVLLTGCAQVNAAATIGKTSISVKQVQDSVAEIMSERAKITTTGMDLQTGEALNRAQVNFFVISELLRQIAKQSKIVVTEAQITKEIATVTEQVGGETEMPAALVNAGIAPRNLREYFATYLISSRISDALLLAGISSSDVTAGVQQLVISKADELKVSINPRYGAWDSASAKITTAVLAGGSVIKK